MDYEAVIGLEVHVQLATRTKIFCGCPNKFGDSANTLTCPVCLGLPGVLPVMNREALRLALRTALALNCEAAGYLRFDRKNYFYPDLPKNFQISQFALPLAGGGHLEFYRDDGTLKKARIRRVHLEEDAGKLIHAETVSLVDFNRTGVPLLEIVSEPDITSPKEAFLYLRALKAILEYLEISDCDMEKGSLRCDANISLRERGAERLGVKTEVKNMNSFRAVEKALAFEAERQQELLEQKEKVIQETRLWNEDAGITSSMRIKEESHDYRYFPEPDLPPFVIEKEEIDKTRASLPELPLKRLARLERDYQLSLHDARVLTSEKGLADYFEELLKFYPNPKKAANWIMGPVLEKLNVEHIDIRAFGLPPERLAELLNLIEDGSVSGKTAKEIFPEMIATGKDAMTIVKGKSLLQISDKKALEEVIAQVIKANPQPVNDYTGGNEKAIMFLVGQVMKQTRGKANPQLVSKILKKKLSELAQ